MFAYATSRSYRRRLLLVVALLGAAGCKIDVGSIDVRLVYTAKVEDNPLNPAFVTKIRVRVEGEGFAPREEVFSRGAGGGRAVLSEVPVGSNRIVTVEGLDATGTVWSRGVSAPVDMNEGTTRVFLYISNVGYFSSPPADTDPGFGQRFRVRMRRSSEDHGRAFHAATALPDGTVLVTGGVAKLDGEWDYPLGGVLPTLALRTAERFDPTSGAFLRDPVDGACDPDLEALCLRRKRAHHGAAWLDKNGLVMLVGGEPFGSPDTEYYDPFTQRLTNGPSLNAARSRAGAAVVPGSLGGLVVVGGMAADGSPLRSLERFDAARGKFDELIVLDDAIEARIGAVAVAFAEGLALIGGWSEGPTAGPSDAVDMIRVENGQYYNTRFSMLEARAGHSATLTVDGKRADVLVCGGVGTGGSVLNSCEVLSLDPDEPGREPARGLNTAEQRWGHTATRLANGRVLLTGGFRNWSKLPGALTSAVELDPRLGTIQTLPPFKSARGGHTATLLGNGMVVLIGGLGSSGNIPSLDYEIFNP